MAYTAAGNEMVKAAQAHADMNLFEAIDVLLEGGLVSAECYAATEKIRKICADEKARCLRRYDRAIKRAGGGTNGL